MTFIYLLDLIKTPDKERILGLLKMMLLQLKDHSTKGKYPLEILRHLVQQYSVMDLREACQVLHASFVNLHDKPDTHVPADLVQEWNVKLIKRHIKHMYSNKNDSNIQHCKAAIPDILREKTLTKRLVPLSGPRDIKTRMNLQ